MHRFTSALLALLVAGNAAICALIATAEPAQADATLAFQNGCTMQQQNTATTAFTAALALVRNANQRIDAMFDAPDARYKKWFSVSNSNHVAQRVFTVFEYLNELAIGNAAITTTCGSAFCQDHPRAVAHITYSTRTLSLCNYFFTPTFSEGHNARRFILVHELTHYVDRTADHRYGCESSQLAGDQKNDNASNYQYFVSEEALGYPCQVPFDQFNDGNQ